VLRPGWHTYCYLFDGTVEVGDKAIGETESALVTDDEAVTVTATGDSIVVASDSNPDAPVTR